MPNTTAAGAFWEGVLDFVFPKRCVGCGDWDTFLCAVCEAGVKRLQPPLCLLCGDEMPAGTDTRGICYDCVASPPAFLDGARSTFVFGGAIREAVHALKYEGVTAIAPLFAGPLAGTIQDTRWQPSLLVPVPLHPSRRRERGYNQAEELARAAGRVLALPVDTGRLRRLRATGTQTHLGRGDRQTNVRGAFAWEGDRLDGQRIVLIDDVMTSGATFAAGAEACLAVGATEVSVLMLARVARD